MPGVKVPPSVRGEVEWLVYDAAGAVSASGRTHNLFLDQGRSAYAAWIRAKVAGFAGSYLHLGTGTRLPAINDTALQYFVTAVNFTAVALDGDYTGRRQTTLGVTQMTGVITELLDAMHSAHPTTAFSRAVLSAQHPSGTTMVINWRWAMEG